MPFNCSATGLEYVNRRREELKYVMVYSLRRNTTCLLQQLMARNKVFLEDNILTALILVNDDNICRDNIYRIICNYYLSPCGTEIPPSSICPEDCSAVQTECPHAWEAAQLGLKEYTIALIRLLFSSHYLTAVQGWVYKSQSLRKVYILASALVKHDIVCMHYVILQSVGACTTPLFTNHKHNYEWVRVPEKKGHIFT